MAGWTPSPHEAMIKGPCVQHLSSPGVSPELAKPTRQRVRQRASRQPQAHGVSSFMFWGEAGRLELIAAAEIRKYYAFCYLE